MLDFAIDLAYEAGADLQAPKAADRGILPSQESPRDRAREDERGDGQQTKGKGKPAHWGESIRRARAPREATRCRRWFPGSQALHVTPPGRYNGLAAVG